MFLSVKMPDEFAQLRRMLIFRVPEGAGVSVVSCLEFSSGVPYVCLPFVCIVSRNRCLIKHLFWKGQTSLSRQLH